MIACEVGFLTSAVGANLIVAARLTNLGMDHISALGILFVLSSICDRGHLFVPRMVDISALEQATYLAANNHAAWPDRFNKYLEIKECTRAEPALAIV